MYNSSIKPNITSRVVNEVSRNNFFEWCKENYGVSRPVDLFVRIYWIEGNHPLELDLVSLNSELSEIIEESSEEEVYDDELDAIKMSITFLKEHNLENVVVLP